MHGKLILYIYIFRKNAARQQIDQYLYILCSRKVTMKTYDVLNIALCIVRVNGLSLRIL